MPKRPSPDLSRLALGIGLRRNEPVLRGRARSVARASGALAAVVGDDGTEGQASLSHYGARRAHAANGAVA
jgi:hypothetical protein